MHVVENISKVGKKIYHSVLLRESYRENGKVKKQTLADLSHCTAEEIAAIKLALKNKGDPGAPESIKEEVELKEGRSVGVVWTLYQLAKTLGMEKALGKTFSGKLALWQVMARLIDQGPVLSAARLAKTHEVGSLLGFARGFDEKDLYENLQWLANNPVLIEQALFSQRQAERSVDLFFYDVTSSYLEGEGNFFEPYGYNRDGKKGKEQIVMGLLCDCQGDPVSAGVHEVNTQDPQIFASHLKTLARFFGCQTITFVGDRGIIKSIQIADLPKGFYYITAITQPQIHTLIQKGLIHPGLFDEQPCEVQKKAVRYLLKRNPIQAREMKETRLSNQHALEALLHRKNLYLKEHSRAKPATALKAVEGKINELKVDKWLRIQQQGRTLSLVPDQEALKEEALLDGCYVIQTNLPKKKADQKMVLDRYRDSAQVEKAFRSSKTSRLKVRPFYAQREKNTCGRALVLMLAYLLLRRLQQAWEGLDLTAAEGLKQLATLGAIEVKLKGQGSYLKIPTPREDSQKLLEALNIRLPHALPHRKVTVVTRKKRINDRSIY